MLSWLPRKRKKIRVSVGEIFRTGLNVLQVDRGKEKAGQLGRGRGTGLFLIRELFDSSCISCQRWGGGGASGGSGVTDGRVEQRHEQTLWNVEWGTEVGAMCLP